MSNEAYRFENIFCLFANSTFQSLKEVDQDQFTSENNLKKPWRKSDSFEKYWGY